MNDEDSGSSSRGRGRAGRLGASRGNDGGADGADCRAASQGRREDEEEGLFYSTTSCSCVCLWLCVVKGVV